ncbi:hypothetical protein D918_02770 [Trichuris suis]|nr:hypothetical protein D918_02770 [Trichuris suis]
MKRLAVLIILLYHVHLPTEEKKMNDTFEEEFDKVMDALAFEIQDFLPKPIQRREQATQEESMQHLEAAVRAFYDISRHLYKEEQYEFQRLISFAKCTSGGTGETIVQFKLLRRAPCKLCDISTGQHVYCSWAGYFRNNTPKETLGYLCYESKDVLHKDEAMLSKLDPCSEWAYEESYIHRLGIPRHMSSMETYFPLYNPPLILSPGDYSCFTVSYVYSAVIQK